MPKNNFKIILKKNSNTVDLKYTLYDSELAVLWFKKIKHIHKIPISSIESNLEDISDLNKIFEEFCKFADIEYHNLEDFSQTTLNSLHELYEKSHTVLSKKPNNDILYKFHHAIHNKEHSNTNTNEITVGWGIKEGALTTNFSCNRFYESELKKNFIYLPWSELGKKPLRYWRDKESDTLKRFLELAKPHITFRAKFLIQLENKIPKNLSKEFIDWFSKYKENWLEYNHISKWDEIDEYSAPLLAVPEHNEDIQNLKNNGYTFNKIIYDSN